MPTLDTLNLNGTQYDLRDPSKYTKPSGGIPVTDLTQSLQNQIASFITVSVNNLTNYYLKSETYTKAEVQQIVDAVKQFTYEVVQTLPTASASTMNKIYLVPSANPETQNTKDEYITIQSGSSYSWEQIGSTAIDLSGYYTSQQTDAAITSALNTALANYTTTANLTVLLAAKEDVANKVTEITESSTDTQYGSAKSVWTLITSAVSSAIDTVKAWANGLFEAKIDNLEERASDIPSEANFDELPLLCGQPMILFGAGTPQESVVPVNWIQLADGGYNWNGTPSALGQVYINTSVNSGGRYTAVRDSNMGLKWVNS